MKKRNLTAALAAALGMLVLILDGKTALSGARDGIDLCLRTLVPSLFPFFVLSNLLTGNLMGQPLKLLRPLGRLCHIPEGAESLLAIGLLGGYPVGAQNIAQCFRSDQLSRSDAQRMVIFCNNAGPAFLFGIIGPLFPDMRYAWLLWIIHMLSALIVGMLLPCEHDHAAVQTQEHTPSFSEALERSVKVMALVCGWVVLMRMLLVILERWVFWAQPAAVQVILAGILELSNGCVQLARIENDGLRFIIAAGFLSLGGVCVAMQTVSVAKGLSLRLYFPGKLLQTAISLLMAMLLQRNIVISPLIIIALLALVVLLAVFLHNSKKAVAIPADLMYNQSIQHKEVSLCCFERK